MIGVAIALMLAAPDKVAVSPQGAGATVPPSTQAAPAAPAPPPDLAAILPYRLDDTHRMTVPVEVSGRGPYAFLVDTGSERTMLTHELADRLALARGSPLTLATVAGRSVTPSARVPELTVAGRRITNIESPLVSAATLGAAGLIGVDGLQNSKVRFDFRRHELHIAPASAPRPAFLRHATDEIVVSASRRLGRLIIHDALVDGVRADLIVDTGSTTSIGNLALQANLARAERQGHQALVESVTGRTMPAEFAVVHDLVIDALTIRSLTIGFTDSYAFKVLGLDRRPALLLGMDALSVMDGIEIDFPHRRVTFALPSESRDDNGQRFAGDSPSRLSGHRMGG